MTDNTGLFKTIFGVLTTCTQYTLDRSICIFLFNRTTLQIFVTYLTGALYVHSLIYKHQHDNRVRCKLSVDTQYVFGNLYFKYVASFNIFRLFMIHHQGEHAAIR